MGAFTTIKQRAPITGGNFAAWGGLFSVVDCSLAYVRQKDDPWNSIASGAVTGGLLQIRRMCHIYFFNIELNVNHSLYIFTEGWGPMIGSAIVGGVILGLIEGVSLLISRVSGQMMISEQSKKDYLS